MSQDAGVHLLSNPANQIPAYSKFDPLQPKIFVNNEIELSIWGDGTF